MTRHPPLAKVRVCADSPAMPESKAAVTFEVQLRTAGTGRIPTPQTIDQFRVDPEAAERCRRWLHGRGVTAHATDFSLACSAPPMVFESLFKVKLKSAGPGWQMDGPIHVPEEIAPMVEDVTIPPAPEFFP